MVDKNGMGGGLALFWNSEVNVHVKSYSLHHIDVEVCNESGKAWRCIGIYGHPEASQKHNTWTLFQRLANLSSLSWCCFGDFNEVMHLHEKNGGNKKNLNMIAEFKEIVKAYNLLDIGYKRYPFTWSNRRYEENYIEERLDRFLCSKN